MIKTQDQVKKSIVVKLKELINFIESEKITNTQLYECFDRQVLEFEGNPNFNKTRLKHTVSFYYDVYESTN